MVRDYRTEAEKTLLDQGGLYTFEDILQAIREGRMQSFTEGDTLVVTQVNEFPRKRVLEIVFVVGEMSDLHTMEHRIEEFRRSIGADIMMATGRLGWTKAHFDGWKPVSANFIKV